MAQAKKATDLSTLQMALVGYQLEKQRIDERIHEIQSQLKGKRSFALAASESAGSRGGRRELSPAARRRIAAAQKKRWAAYRKNKAAAKTA